MKEKHSVFLSLGSNIGQSKNHVKRAIGYLSQNDSIKTELISSLYKTQPVGYSNQKWFTNCVIKVNTDLPAKDLFHYTQCIEKKYKKRSPVKWGPREIDIDLLFYDNVITKTEELILPHPQLHLRRFVLAPLAEIAPHFIHPVFNKRISTILIELCESKGVTRIVLKDNQLGSLYD